jgi:hypothetical protein
MRNTWRDSAGTNPRSRAREPNRRSASCSTRVAGSTSASAASVGIMPLPARTSSGSPVSARSRLSWALTAGWVDASFMAARETLRSVIKVCRTRIS